MGPASRKRRASGSVCRERGKRRVAGYILMGRRLSRWKGHTTSWRRRSRSWWTTTWRRDIRGRLRRLSIGSQRQLGFNQGSTMKISREDVVRVAELAYLELSEGELEKYRQQLDEILEDLANMNQLD